MVYEVLSKKYKLDRAQIVLAFKGCKLLEISTPRTLGIDDANCEIQVYDSASFSLSKQQERLKTASLLQAADTEDDQQSELPEAESEKETSQLVIKIKDSQKEPAKLKVKPVFSYLRSW